MSGTHNSTSAERYRATISPEEKARRTAEAMQEREKLRAETAERRQNGR